jgi:hypothetical protein
VACAQAALNANAASSSKPRALGGIPGAPGDAGANGAASTTTAAAAAVAGSAAVSGGAGATSPGSAEGDATGGAFHELDAMLRGQAMLGGGTGAHDSAELRVKLDKLREKLQLQIEDLTDDLKSVREERDAAFESLQQAKVSEMRACVCVCVRSW